MEHLGDLLEHPDDELIEITSMGSATPQYIRGVPWSDVQLGYARSRFVAGLIDADEFEAELDRIVATCRLRGRT